MEWLGPEWDRGAFLFAQGRDLFGRGENGRGVATKVRDDDCALGAIDQTGTAQKRCEIIGLAMVVEDFIVQRGEELRETTRPPCCAIDGSTASVRSMVKRACVASSSLCIRRE